MNIVYEGVRNGEFLISEANGSRSRDTVSIDANEPTMASGTALGIYTGSNLYGKYSPDATNGLEVCRAILYTATTTSTSIQAVVAICRDAEVSFERTSGIDSESQKDLLNVGIVVRGPHHQFVAPAPVVAP